MIIVVCMYVVPLVGGSALSVDPQRVIYITPPGRQWHEIRSITLLKCQSPTFTGRRAFAPICLTSVQQPAIILPLKINIPYPHALVANASETDIILCFTI